MGNLYLSFGAWGYLALLAAVPLLWWQSWRGLAALGGVRRWLVLLARTLVLTLLIFAIAEVQMVRKSDRLTVLYLLDQSVSIPAEQRSAMLGYVNAAVRKHRHAEDRAGVIVFARDAAVEVPARADSVEMTAVENTLDEERTSLAGAVKLALACFPADSAKRIVLVSDGNENVGDVREELRRADSTGVDVVPARYTTPSEVVLDRLTIPADVRRGQPFDVRAVLSNLADAATGKAAEVAGRLVITESAGGKSRVVSDEPVVLPPGKKVFTVRQQIDEADFYTYEARFVPDKSEQDLRLQNNRATGFAHVRGKGRVLLIEDQEHPGEYERMVRQLRFDGLEVMVRAAGAFTSLADLQAFDAVVLAGAPREQFTDEQIAMLARNTQQFGCGMVMVGGPGSFGPGGWTGTEVEAAMPVDFQIENAQVSPVGALLLVIDSSGSMTGEKVELCKAAAIASAKTLGQRDFVGCITFNVDARWVVPMTRASNIDAITRRIRRIGADGGTLMMPAMQMARKGLNQCEAAIKHIVVLTDGQTMGDGYEALSRDMAQEKITISTVAVGADADAGLLERIASQGRGKFYRVLNPKALPKIFMQEARRVSRPLIFDRFPVSPEIEAPHEILAACGELPPVKGYVLTTRKESPLVEICAAAAKPSGKQYGTILAAWQYGLGRTVALTTDAGARWAGDWWNDSKSAGVFTQTVRWAMRPAGEAANFAVAAEIDSDRVRMVVNALDTDDAFLNFLQINGSVVGPDLKPQSFFLEQTAPGRYVGVFPVKDAGPYFVMVNHSKQGTAPILYGLNVPASAEYRDRAENAPLLQSLSHRDAPGEPSGMLIEGLGAAKVESLLAADSFRRGGLPEVTFRQDVWPWAAFLASCVFFCDVFFRRVQVNLAWVAPAASRVAGWLLRRKAQVVSTPMIERLRSRKAEVNEQMETLRANARFSAPEGADAQLPDTELAAGPSSTLLRDAIVEPAAASTYTERLLEAKRKAIKRRDEGQATAE